MPTNIWIQMPGDDTSAGDVEPEVPPVQQTPAPSEEPSLFNAPATPKAEVASKPAVQAKQPEPVRVEPEVKPAPIAEWVEEPRIRRRPPTPTPASPADEAKPAKGKRTTKKAAAPKATKATATKSRSRKKKAEAEGEEPKVRIADDLPVTKVGDRHLATDEPVDPEAVRKVHAPRDLDQIPEEDESR
jgi:hypothetical protein